MEGCGDDGKGACHASDLEIALNAQKLAELKYDPTGQQQKKNREVAWEVVDEISPDGWKTSIMVSAGWGSNLNANGKKVPTVLYGGFSLVRDNHGGIQLFYETLDIEFNPTLQLNPGEQAQPSELYGIGISATKGPIWRTDGKVFVTNDYEGAAHSSGGGWGIVTADYYESFPNPNIKGLDVGVSAGSPSLWSISTQAHPLFDMDRIDFSFWDNP